MVLGYYATWYKQKPVWEAVTAMQLWESLQWEMTKWLWRRSFSCWENTEKSAFSISKIQPFQSPSSCPVHSQIRIIHQVKIGNSLVKSWSSWKPPSHRWWPSATSATSFTSLGHALRYGSDWFSPWSFGRFLCWIWNVWEPRKSQGSLL